MKGRVEKFSSIEEMNRAPVSANADSGFERFARQCARFWVIAPRIYPRGVFKFRSVDEARVARERISAKRGR
jgi:hypothetical protein